MASIYSIRVVKSAAALTAICFCLQTQSLATDSVASNPTAEISVSVVMVHRSCFSDTLQVSGLVVPRDDILVRSSREGMQISEVLVEPGDSVTSGQVLARLSAPDSQISRSLSIPVQSPAAGIVISKKVAIGARLGQRHAIVSNSWGRGDGALGRYASQDASASSKPVGKSRSPGCW
jgi:HlyD family secretion protein